jgi:C-terminal processing protease CtpA/Prc
LKICRHHISTITAIYLIGSLCVCNYTNSNDNFQTKHVINAAATETENLAVLCKVWGFLKYYHPNVNNGNYNWDQELFKILPIIESCDSIVTRNEMLSDWIERLGFFETEAKEIDSSKITAYPHLDWVLEQDVLGDKLSHQLILIKLAKRPPISHYVSFTGAGNAVFENEISYSNSLFPPENLRLLSLFRYWNIIQYFYPYRYLISDWDEVLSAFIPLFINTKNQREYTKLCLRLVSSIHDTHANVFGSQTIDSLKGIFICPFRIEWIENKYVVTGVYENTSSTINKVRIGDVIENIDGFSIDSLVKMYTPYTSASNQDALLKILGSSSGFILRSNNLIADLIVSTKGVQKKVLINRLPLRKINPRFYWAVEKQNSFSFIDSSIGYIYTEALKSTAIDSIISAFQSTKGLIIDLRCYPGVFMAFTYGKWLKSMETPFAKISTTTMEMPGRFAFKKPVVNGQNFDNYRGRVVVIVNSSTLSQAEYTAMALRTIPGAVVLGSKTAGADGDVSLITLPGGIKTLITGTGVYYPNGKETQRVGIRPDIEALPSIKGVREMRDELLEAALHVIKR